MPAANPKRDFAVEVVRRLRAAGFQALWAGGCVRDFLLGREPGDYDVATNALPDQVRDLFGHRRTLAVGASFGVIIVLGPKPAGDAGSKRSVMAEKDRLNPPLAAGNARSKRPDVAEKDCLKPPLAAGSVEVATFRTEGPYLDGRRPQHVAFSSPEEDAQRRDFTINGMFYDPVEQQVIDYVGGEKDLGARIVRAIGDPYARMREDKLRMLRGVRFAATLEFELDAPTAAAIREMAPEITVVSIERIAQELRRMLVDPHRRRAMELAHELCLLQVILPELDLPSLETMADAGHPQVRGWETMLRMLAHLQEPDFELAAATLLHHVVRPEANDAPRVPGQFRNPRKEQAEIVGGICKRLRLSNRETEDIAWLVGHQYVLLDAPHLPLHALKRVLAHPLRDQLLKLARAEALATESHLTPIAFCEEYVRTTPPEEIDPPPLLTGDDLIQLGHRPGPHFKEWLDTLRNAQLDGEIRTRDDAITFVRSL